MTGVKFFTQTNSISGLLVSERIKLYEGEMGVSIALAACGGFWASQDQLSPFLRLFKRIAEQANPISGTVYLSNLRLYPALLLLYASGISALASENFVYLKELLYSTVTIDPYKAEKGAASVIHNRTVIDHNHQKLLPGHESSFTPLCDHIFEMLREPLSDYLPGDKIYETTFNLFEYLFCLVHADQRISKVDLRAQFEKDSESHLWGPPGRFMWRWNEYGYAEHARPEAVLNKHVHALLAAGCFEASNAEDSEKYEMVQRGIGKFIQLVQNQWHIF